MVTNAIEEEVETRAEKASKVADRSLRTIISGSEVGAVRRIVLYSLLVLALGVIAVSALGGLAPIAVVLALGITILLAVTDKLA